MANISKTKTLFFTTSPRSPFKMISEIRFLTDHYSGKKWNRATQKEFMLELVQQDFWDGESSLKDPDFSARDRINRSPKALGFVDLSPNVSLTMAGDALIHSPFKEEVLLRQLLKFQLPSVFHTLDKNHQDLFFIKPYLEIIRLIHYFGSLSFDELKLFGLQMRNYRDFENIVKEIEQFRVDKLNNKGNYKRFVYSVLVRVVQKIYSDEIQKGQTTTRESSENNVKKFIQTKARNMRDYTDACFRYLRNTGLFSVSQIGKSISIIPERKKEVEFILETVSRDPVFIDDEVNYKKYLFDASVPVLYTDQKGHLIEQLSHFGIDIGKQQLSLNDLKILLKEKASERKKNILACEVERIKSYDEYNSILAMYDDILHKNVYDPSLMLEWNTWRAMTMIDGGVVTANLEFDDFGAPKSTALGKKADIVCDYGDFGLTVEVTMQTGQRQYEMEGESVARHLAMYKKEINKEAYSLFIAPKINESCIAYFYSLYRIHISYYGGYSYILPLELDVFIKMLQDSYEASDVPDSGHIEKLFKKAIELAWSTDNEEEWYEEVKEYALHWL